MFLLYWPLALLHGDVNKCRRDSRRHPKRGNNNKKGNRTWRRSSGDRARRLLSRIAIRRKFCRGFNCCHLSQARATMSAHVYKKTNVSGSILRGRERRYRSRAVNVTRCTRIPGVSKGDLLLMAYWNGMSTVIKRDGPTAPWRSPLNVRRYIRAWRGARETRENRAQSRGSAESTDRFLSLWLLGYIVSEAREGSIKMISDALMRNYETSRRSLFSPRHSVGYHLWTYGILNCKR